MAMEAGSVEVFDDETHKGSGLALALYEADAGTLANFAQPVEIALPSIGLPAIPIPAFPPVLPHTTLFCPFDEGPEEKLE